MRNLVYLAALMILTGSCTKKDSFFYDENAGLHFGGNLKTTYNFATQFDPQSPAWERYFYGDSLRSDTLLYTVDLLGEPAGQDREYYLKTVVLEGQDPRNAPEIEFMNPYVLQAGRIRDTIEIVILRPATRGEFSTGVTFDLERSGSAFGKGVEERSVMEFVISDRYQEPPGWNTFYFGEYSEEKYAFFVTVLNAEYVSWMEWMFSYYQEVLRDRLKNYNEKNPENPKEFTFPG